MHQGAWLVWALSAALVCATTTNPYYLLLLGAVAGLVYAACHRAEAPYGAWRIFLGFGLVALVLRTVLVVFSSVTASSVAAAALEGLRLATLLVVFGAFNSVTDSFALLKLAPRRWHEPALAAALALSIAPRMMAAAGQVREAQRLRGIDERRWRALPALAVPILATGMEDAVTLAESMDARGHGRGRRSRYRPQPFGAGAWTTALGATLACITFLVLARAGVGDAAYSPWPLVWPGVSVVMTLAVASLAVPALVSFERGQ